MTSNLLCALTLLGCASTFTAAQMSCNGRCGAEYYRGYGCQCDYTCLLYGECCKDYESLCTTQDSCKGRCGETFQRGRPCSCDAECQLYNQCCSDYTVSCSTEETSGAPERERVTPTIAYTYTERMSTVAYDSYSGSYQEVSGASPSPDGASGSGDYLPDPLENASVQPTVSDLLVSSGLESTTEMFSGEQPSTDKPTEAVKFYSSINPTTDSTDGSGSGSGSGPFCPPTDPSLDPEDDSNLSSAAGTTSDPITEAMTTASAEGSVSGVFNTSSGSPFTTMIMPTVIPSQDPTTNMTKLGSSLESSTWSGTWMTTDSSGTVEQTTAEPLVSTMESSTWSGTWMTADDSGTAMMVTPTPTATKPKPSEPTSETQDKPILFTPPATEPTPTEPASKPEPLDTAVTTKMVTDYQADDSNSTDLCSGHPISAVTTLKNGTMVVFRGHNFWMLDANRVPGPARGITDYWGVPSPIDTVFTRCNCEGKTYMFKGGQYWRFKNAALDPGYPKVVSVGFGGLRGHITAALSVPQYSTRKESVYFFKQGEQVQQYSYQFGTRPKCERKVKVYQVFQQYRSRLPRQAVSVLGPAFNIRTSWPGFPSSITAAVSVPNSYIPEGYKYQVFSKSKVYNIRVDGGHPVLAVPQAAPSSQSDFFKCPQRV
ncbi:proteoglycan 4b [Genypterus blacodes]|uniref:proteoglycan 4b n=1 Tax=Genypterus blacodes TaxID=154954 RepID=UPI003F75D05F